MKFKFLLVSTFLIDVLILKSSANADEHPLSDCASLQLKSCKFTGKSENLILCAKLDQNHSNHGA